MSYNQNFLCCIGAELKNSTTQTTRMNQIYLYRAFENQTLDDMLSDGFFDEALGILRQDDLLLLYSPNEPLAPHAIYARVASATSDGIEIEKVDIDSRIKQIEPAIKWLGMRSSYFELSAGLAPLNQEPLGLKQYTNCRPADFTRIPTKTYEETNPNLNTDFAQFLQVGALVVDSYGTLGVVEQFAGTQTQYDNVLIATLVSGNSANKTTDFKNPITDTNKGITEADVNQAVSGANKIATMEDLREQLLSSIRFKGYVSTTEPNGATYALKNGDLWINASAMPTTFPVPAEDIRVYNGTNWTDTTETYTPIDLDAWRNVNDTEGYYWFGGEWTVMSTDLSPEDFILDNGGKWRIKDSVNLRGYPTVSNPPISNNGIVNKKTMDDLLALKAPINNPTFTGAPKTPTPTTAADGTQIANVDYVQGVLAASSNTPNFIHIKYTSAVKYGQAPLLTSLYGTSNTGLTYFSPNVLTVEPCQLRLEVDGAVRYFQNTAAFDFDPAAHLDSGTALQAGKFYTIFLVPDGAGVGLIVSLNDAPTGYTDYRAIAWFSTLCVDAGTITGGHTASGYTAGMIIPNSVATVRFRPIGTPRGSVYIDLIDSWAHIYLQSGTGFNTKSEWGNTPTRSRCYANHVRDMIKIGYFLPNDNEFNILAFNSNEKTSIVNSNESTAASNTGGFKDTAGRRMISQYFCESCVGQLWQWLNGSSGNGSQNWVDINLDDNATGATYGNVYPLLAGGRWPNGAHCGAATRNGSTSRSTLNSDNGARGLSRTFRYSGD